MSLSAVASKIVGTLSSIATLPRQKLSMLSLINKKIKKKLPHCL